MKSAASSSSARCDSPTVGPSQACADAAMAALTDGSPWRAKLLPAERLLYVESTRREMNWKVLVEQFLEGYHIRSTHTNTFFPLQYDDLNIVETFGPNSRITFPYRNIERLRDRPESAWTTDARVTYVYQLFPNAMVATFPDFVLSVVIDPVDVGQSTVTVSAMVTPDVARTSIQSRPAKMVSLGVPTRYWRGVRWRTTRCRRECNAACTPARTRLWSSAATKARSDTSTPPSMNGSLD